MLSILKQLKNQHTEINAKRAKVPEMKQELLKFIHQQNEDFNIIQKNITGTNKNSKLTIEDVSE